MGLTEKIAKAEELGAAAFAAGKKRVPGWDKDLMAMHEPWATSNAAGIAASKRNIEVMNAWCKGWDTANLAAPVEV